MTNVKVSNYTLTPASNNFGNTLLTLPDYNPVNASRLVRVYNVTRGKIVYDTSASTGSASASGTVITLSGGPNTSKMLAGDAYEVVYDDPAVSSGGGGGGGGTVTAAATGLPVKPGTDGFPVTATAAPEGLPVQAGTNGLAVSAASGTGLPVKSASTDGVYVQPGLNGFPVSAAAAGLPVQPGSNGFPVTSNGERSFLRDDFPGTGLDTTKWDWTPGAGASLSVASSILTLNSGTTANAVSILRSKSTFVLPARLFAMLMLSQRIVNCDVYLEFVNAAGDTRASWLFTGTSATGASIVASNNGIKADADTGVTITNSAVYALYELDGDDTGWDWNERTLNSSSSANVRGLRSRTVPGGGEPLYAQIRIINGSTAPASNTAVTVEAIVSHGITRLPVEIARGRGIAGANDSVPVVINNGLTISTVNTGNVVRPVTGQIDETTTALGASGVYTGATRDFGTDVSLRSSRVRWTFSATAAALGAAAHLYLDESLDGTTWFTTQQTPLPIDAGYHTGEWSIGHMRYYRFRIVNGATAMTALRLTQINVRGDGSTGDIRSNLPFPLTPVAGTVLAASGVITGPTLDLGVNHQWDKVRSFATNSDTTASGTLRVQVSVDGTNWQTVGGPYSIAATATDCREIFLGPARYVRVQYTNGTTAATAALVLAMSLVSL